jgi:hypothetical protein
MANPYLPVDMAVTMSMLVRGMLRHISTVVSMTLRLEQFCICPWSFEYSSLIQSVMYTTEVK